MYATNFDKCIPVGEMIACVMGFKKSTLQCQMIACGTGLKMKKGKKKEREKKKVLPRYMTLRGHSTNKPMYGISILIFINIIIEHSTDKSMYGISIKLIFINIII